MKSEMAVDVQRDTSDKYPNTQGRSSGKTKARDIVIKESL